jgi:DNA invertase Pin-like site-specific DNA recombinase
LYARVSTSEQTVEPQLHALRGYAHARGLEIAGEFVDHGVSGAKDRRPALDRLMADGRRRRFDAVACVRLDRLARSVRHLTALAAEFEALNISLIVVDQSLDTSCPSGRLLFHVLASVSEFEKDLIRERVSAGMRAAKVAGKRLGRRRVLAGPGSIRLEGLYRKGASLRSIARELGVGKATVVREVQRLGLRRAAA